MKNKLSSLLLILVASAQGLLAQAPLPQETAEKTYLPQEDGYVKDLLPFLREFPTDSYQVCEVKNEGFFYVDDIEDGIKDWLRKGVAWEQNIKDILKAHIKEGTIVVDVGAHVGTHTLTMAHCVGEKGTVFAFEPQPKLFRELFMNCSINHLSNVKLMPFAIGKESGEVELSPLAAGNEGGTGVRVLENGSSANVKKAPLKKLDSFNLTNVSLMKVDVEGMEDQFLEGAKATIAKNKPVIVIEIMGGYFYETAPPEVKTRIDNTIKILNGMGYDVKNIHAHDYLATPKK